MLLLSFQPPRQICLLRPRMHCTQRSPRTPHDPQRDLARTPQARRILTEYNLKHDECGWRDLSGFSIGNRYTPDAPPTSPSLGLQGGS